MTIFRDSASLHEVEINRGGGFYLSTLKAQNLARVVAYRLKLTPSQTDLVAAYFNGQWVHDRLDLAVTGDELTTVASIVAWFSEDEVEDRETYADGFVDCRARAFVLHGLGGTAVLVKRYAVVNPA